MMTIDMIEPPTREALFMRLYQAVFPMVSAFIHKNGGSFEEARDVFQDALVIYYEKTLEPGFTAHLGETPYVMGICRHLWYRRHRQNKLMQPLDNAPGKQVQPEEAPVVSERIMQYIEQSGKKCLDLLKAFYYDQLKMTDIAAVFGFSGERSVAAQKYKCLEKIRTMIRDQSLSKEDFYE